MQGESSTQRKVSMVPFVFSIPFVLRWGGSISSDSFLPSIMLVVVIIVTVVIVVVILIVIVVVIIGVVIVVAIIGVVVIVDGVSSILKFSFVIIGFLRRIVFYYLLHQPLGYGNGFLQSLRVKQHNSMGPLLKVSDEDKKKGIHKPKKRLKDSTENPEARKQLSRPARLIIMWPPSGLKGLLHMLNATVIPMKGIKYLREDGNKDFRQNSNFEAMLREFLVLILLFPFYFISLMYNRDIVQIK
ncbi:hypothetical protein Tco_0109318 [Tanacetum coccineum]